MTHRSTFKPQVPLFSILLLVLCTKVGVTQSSSQPMEVSVLDHRPLAAAIRELEERHGWIITYEDPPYEWAADSKDLAKAARAGEKPQRKALVPVQRAFVMSYTKADGSRPYDLLSSMLLQYDESGKNDAFALLREGRVYHIVPRRSANSKGNQTERRSLFDVRVNIDAGERGAVDQIRLVLAKVSEATGIYVAVGSGSGRLLDAGRLHQRVVNERARDVITRAVAATGADISWRLFCTPGSRVEECSLNLHLVRSRSSN